MKDRLKNDKDVQQFISDNNNLINIFYDHSYTMFNLTPREALTLFADISISEYNLRKFYALSKSLVINEHENQAYL